MSLVPSRLACLLACVPLAFSTACESGPKPQTVVNRDPHGEPDVTRYIARLQSPERLEELQIDRVLETLAPKSDAMIGDLGCGPGLFALAFANACPRGVIFASDVEPAQLDRVRDHIARTSLANIVPVLASPENPHFPPGRLDLVFIADTYHHIEARVEYMRRLQSVLKPDGRLALLEYKAGALPLGPPPEHKLAAGVLEGELTEAGWVLVQRYDTHPYHDFEVWRPAQAWEHSGR
jgi:SAM-dependent methyltransferase